MTHEAQPMRSALSGFHWLDPMRLVFIGFFLFGTMGVITIKELGLNPVISIIFAAIVMVAYTLYCGSRKFAVSVEILGDNIYYMGFLFTLVSLAYTLYKFSSAEDDIIDQIIKNFGIALSTTLFGVVGRVYFNQTRDQGDPDSISLDPNADDAEALAEARDLLNHEMVICRKIITEQGTALSLSVREVAETLLSMHSSLAHVTDSARAINNQLIEQKAHFQQQIEEESKAFDDLNKNVRANALHSIETLNELQSGLDKIVRFRAGAQ